MGAIYRLAYMTLVAASGEDAGAGIEWLHPGNESDKEALSFRQNGRCLVFLSKPPNPLHFLRDCKWATRGWTYQEHVMSKRCVFFTPHEAVFSSEGKIWREAYALVDRDAAWCRWAASTGNKILLRHTFSNEEGKSAQSQLPYAQAVEEYTHRELSDEGDRLAAFSGILGLISQEQFPSGQPTEALSGLTGTASSGSKTYNFAEGLFWVPTDLAVCHRIRHDSAKRRALPSWSWVGWSGPVRLYRASRSHDTFSMDATIMNRNNVKASGEYVDVKRQFLPKPCGLSVQEGFVLHLFLPVVRSRLEPHYTRSRHRLSSPTRSVPDQVPISYVVTASLPGPRIGGGNTKRFHPQCVISIPDCDFAFDPQTMYDFVLFPSRGSWSFPIEDQHLKAKVVHVMLVRRSGNFYERIALTLFGYMAHTLKDYEYVRLI